MSVTFKNIVARNIAKYRKAAGLTQSQLAEKLSYSDKSVSKWERAEGTPDTETLIAMARLFGVTVNELIFEKRYVMLAVSVVFAPVIEETLVRGVVFGTIRPASRVLAYIVSALLFTLMHNWQYFGLHPFLSILLSCLPYIPASVALAWVYEKAGTIWAPITLHALINAMSFGLLNL